MDFFQSIPTHMDYVGQGKAESWSRYIISFFAAVGFLVGYGLQQFSLTVYILGAGVALAVLLTVPPWPIFRKNPLRWQRARPDETDDAPTTKKGKKK